MSEPSELEPLVEELAATLSELQRELEREPRPSRLRDLLRFTEQYTIPTVIAVLEANIRLLELLAGAIRLADGRLEEPDRERTAERTLAAVDRGLSEVSDALAGRPPDSDARRLFDEARDLRTEIETRLEADAGDGRPRTERETHEVPVDVEAELDSIRRELDEDDADDRKVDADDRKVDADDRDPDE